MKLELQSAANFLVHLIRLGRRNPSVNEQQLEKFKAAIVEVLRRRYRDHWFPEKPFKGSGYRCIRINGKMDPVIAQAAETCGLAANLIHSTFPSELTMWIDPLEVSYRIGENGSICVLYEHKASKKETTTDPSQPEAWRPTSTSNSTSSTATVVVSNASGPGSGNNTVDNGGLQQQKRATSPLSSPTKLKTTQQATTSSSFSSPSSPFHNNQLNNQHHHNIQQHNQSQQRFNNLNQQNVNNKNAVNDLNQRMGVLGLKPSEASLFHTGSTGMSNSGAVTNLASTNSQQEAHQQLCGNTADSLYKIDYLMDPRKSVSIEQLAAYVSS
jgi:protein Tob/BTG